MKNNIISFGFENWRTLTDTEINLGTVAKVAQAFADYLIIHSHEKDVLKVGVGYDGRNKSKEFALLFSRILSGNNIIVFLADKISASPALTYFVKENNLNAGIIITGGRSPAVYNGIKFLSSSGNILSKEKLNEIESYIGKELIQADDEKIYQVDIRSKYYEQLDNLIDFSAIRQSGINFLIDSMSGAGQQIIENLLIINDISSKTIFKFSENDFSGRVPNPIKENLEPLISELKKSHSFSFAFATDGDADRVAVITDKGLILDDNHTALLLIDYIFNSRNVSGQIIKSFNLTEKIEELFGNKITELPVGLRFFSEDTIKESFLAGFESEGSYIWGKGTPYRDGMLTALIFGEMLAKSGYTKLSDYIETKKELLKDIYCGNEIFQNFNVEVLNKLIESPLEKIGNYTIKSFHYFRELNNEINSLKYNLEGDRRWVVLRKSDHFPLIKIYVEASTYNEVQEILDAFRIILQK